MKLVDDIEGSGRLAEEDKDLLECLETMAAEIEGEVVELGGKGER